MLTGLNKVLSDSIVYLGGLFYAKQKKKFI